MPVANECGRAQVMEGAAVAVERVSFRYDHVPPDRRWTVEDVSFSIGFGEVLGIVGPNGSGKSSLLKLMAGLLRPASGAVFVEGRAVATLTPSDVAGILAVVPQEQPPLFPFSVAETVLMGRFPHRKRGWWNMGVGAETEADLVAVHQAMVETDVLALADRLLSDLSGGERQRVLIARALAQEPDILLLDEPTAFLDLSHQIDMCSLVQRLARERHLTVGLVTHDLNVASLLCDRVVMMREGTVRAIGTPAEILRQDILHDVYGCDVMIDRHPQTGRPRVTLPIQAPQDEHRIRAGT
ncbi:ABC transporter ATP-binding protein [Candidatus Nitrospira inopinata]|nr:ABC transporter ATP-binding protein [Candidatus Nitrospira inopinata]